MADDELKLTRRYFLQQSAMSTALAGGLYSIAQKTDALAQTNPVQVQAAESGTHDYPYHTP